jgi:NhaP-type Na+/H+ or K+/H+ antiporter
LTLRVVDVRESAGPAIRLTLLNFIFTTAAVASVAVAFMEFETIQALLLGSILGGTSSAFVGSVLRHLQARESTSAVLLLESTLSDVLTLPIPLMLLEVYALGSLRPGVVGVQIASSLILSGLLGFAGALSWSFFLNRVRNLENAMFTTPAFVFMIYGLVEFIGSSGPIAVLAFGVTLGNIDALKESFLRDLIKRGPVALNQTEKVFFAEVVFLLRTFFFVYIGLAVHITNWWFVTIGLLLTLLLYFVRIPAVHWSLPRSVSVREASLVTALRATGLGSAVMASIPLQRGVEGGDLIQILAFSVILFSTLLSTAFIVVVERGAFSSFSQWLFKGFSEETNG